MEPKYAESGVEFMRQVADGRMIGTVSDGVPHVLGQPATTFRAWVEEHRGALLERGQQ